MTGRKTRARSQYEQDMKLGWRMMGHGLELVGEIGAGILIGYAADWYFNTSPRWTAVGAIAGVVIGLINFIRAAIRIHASLGPPPTHLRPLPPEPPPRSDRLDEIDPDEIDPSDFDEPDLTAR